MIISEIWLLQPFNATGERKSQEKSIKKGISPPAQERADILHGVQVPHIFGHLATTIAPKSV